MHILGFKFDKLEFSNGLSGLNDSLLIYLNLLFYWPRRKYTIKELIKSWLFFLSGGENVEVFYRLYTELYVLPLVTQLSVGEGLMPLNGLNPQYFRDCPKPGPGFPTSCVVWSFFSVFSELMWEVIVRFVGIVDHQCFNFLFKT
jgi:hypothetical protein